MSRTSAGDVRTRRYAAVLAALTVLFALRVAGQALQRWSPVDALPPFGAFQGSSIAYGLLLSIQIVMLVWMSAISVQVGRGRRRRDPRAARVLAWTGGIYMAGSLGRTAVGLTVADAPAWFTAWISAIFHVILAAFVLTLAAYHATPPGRERQA
jgi:hypothetical protein